ncbi:MAG: hypothetical protein QXH08_00015 [Candidatus Hadarchaeales archaeon]
MSWASKDSARRLTDLFRSEFVSLRPSVSASFAPRSPFADSDLESEEGRLRLARAAIQAVRRFTPSDWLALWWLGRVPLPFLYLHRLCYPDEGADSVMKRLRLYCDRMVLDRLELRYLCASRGMSGAVILREGDRGGLFDCYFVGYFGDLLLRELGMEPCYEFFRRSSDGRPRSVRGVVEKVVHQAETSRLLLLLLDEADRARRGEGPEPPYRLLSWRPESVCSRSYFLPRSPGSPEPAEGRYPPRLLLRRSFRPDALLELEPLIPPGLVFRAYLEYTSDDDDLPTYVERLGRKMRTYLDYWRYGEWRLFLSSFPPVLFFCESATGASVVGEALISVLEKVNRERGSTSMPFSIYLSCFEWLESSSSFASSSWVRLVGRGRAADLVFSAESAFPLLSFSSLVRAEASSRRPLLPEEEERVAEALRAALARRGGREDEVKEAVCEMLGELRIKEGSDLPPLVGGEPPPDPEAMRATFLRSVLRGRTALL